MKRMLNLALFAFVTILALYVALVALVYLGQERMVYFPQRDIGWTPAAMDAPYEDVWMTTSDGVRIHGWFIPAPNARGTVLYFHGNGNNISGSMWDATAAYRLGLNGFFVDYRGYGQSEGTPSEQGLYADAEAAWRHLTDERGISPDEIIIMGQSLGGGVASWLAQQHTPAALVLMSTFTSAVDLGAETYPILPVHLLARNRYPTIERLPDIDALVLITHARGDRVIPFVHSERLYAAAQEPKTLLELEGGHDRGFMALYEQRPEDLETFLTAVLPAEPAPAVP